MPRFTDDHGGPTGAWGLTACFEATRVRQKAYVFHDLDHDTLKIGSLSANATFLVGSATAQRCKPCERTADRRSLFQKVALRSRNRHYSASGNLPNGINLQE